MTAVLYCNLVIHSIIHTLVVHNHQTVQNQDRLAQDQVDLEDQGPVDRDLQEVPLGHQDLQDQDPESKKYPIFQCWSN